MRFPFVLDKAYAVLPYSPDAQAREVGFYRESGELITSLLIEYDENPADWVYLSSSLFGEKRILIECDETLIGLMRTSDEKRKENHFSFHYTPSFGWINDPNGLHYRNGLYHMYYQTNPVSRNWNNMSWGHAVSRDLVSFEEKDPVFLPKDSTWVIFSGSALDGEFAYTVANVKGDRRFYQERRFSDDGFSFGESEVIIPSFVSDERDPRLFKYKGRKYILLWLKGNTFALFADEGGRYTLVNEFDAEDAWECPDIYIIGDRLFFTSADGFYFEAVIDSSGMRLIGKRKKMFITALPYASQSFTGLDDTFIVSWLRVQTPHLRTAGAMSIIRRIGLDGDCLVLEPNGDLMKRFAEGGTYRGAYSSEDEALYLETEGALEGDIGGTPFSYDPESATIVLGDESASFSFPPSGLRIFIDHEIAEITDSGCKELAAFEIKHENGYHRGVRISHPDSLIKEFLWR